MHICQEYRKILVNKHNHKDLNIVPKIIVTKDHILILTNQYQYQSIMEHYHLENYPNPTTITTTTTTITIKMVIDRNNIDNKIIKD